MNFTLQNMVADAVDQAVDNFVVYREKLPSGDPFSFDLSLQNHDALLFEVDGCHVPRLLDEVIPQCMIRGVPLWPCYLDGQPRDGVDEPFFFGVDAGPSIWWGQQMTPRECLDLSFDPKYAGWVEVPGGYSHKHNPGVVINV
jgi:hypothetical protein